MVADASLIGRGGRSGLRKGMEDVPDLFGCGRGWVCKEVRS